MALQDPLHRLLGLGKGLEPAAVKSQPERSLSSLAVGAHRCKSVWIHHTRVKPAAPPNEEGQWTAHEHLKEFLLKTREPE